MVAPRFWNQARRWWKKTRRVSEPSRRALCPVVEQLEDRLTPSAYLWVNFGFNYTGGSLTVTNSQMQDSGVNGPTGVFGNGYSLISLTQTVINRNLDFNGDGVANATDARLLANQILADVRRAYQPFAVTVLELDSIGINGVKTALATYSSNDAYIFATGATPSSLQTRPGITTTGIAPIDIGNTQDNTGFAFADTIASLASGSLTVYASDIAENIAHEAGHTFGLEHVDPTQAIAAGNTMLTTYTSNTPFLFHRFNMPLAPTNSAPYNSGTQNDYAVLAANVGLSATGAGYITGTGVNDQIFLQAGAGGATIVTVNAYQDTAYTNLLGSTSYTIPYVTQLTVEAGQGNDDIVIDGNLGAISLYVRGGGGTDKVEVNAPAGASKFYVNATTVDEVSSTGFPLVYYNDYGEAEALQINGSAPTSVVIPATSATTPPITTNGVGQVLLAPQVAGQQVLSPVTIVNATSISVGVGRADLVTGRVTIQSPNVLTALTVNDSSDPSFTNWFADANSVTHGAPIVLFDSGRVPTMQLLGGSGGSQMYLGSSIAPLDKLPPTITVTGSGSNSQLTVSGLDSIANDYRVSQGAVTVFHTFLQRTTFVHQLTNQINYSKLTGLEVDGSVANGNLFHVYSSAASTPVMLVGGPKADLFDVGDPSHSIDLVLGAVTAKATGLGGRLYVDDSGTTYPLSHVSFNVAAGQVTRQDSYPLGLRTIVLNATINYAGLAQLYLNGGNVNTSVLVQSTSMGTPVAITAGSLATSFQVGDATHSLDSLQSVLTLSGNSSPLVFNDAAQTIGQADDIYTDHLDHGPSGGTLGNPVYYSNLAGITFYTGQGNGVAVHGSAANTPVTVNGHAGVQEEFGADTFDDNGPVSFLAPVAFHGADPFSFAFYYDAFATTQQTYTFSVDPNVPTRQLVQQTGQVPVSYDGVDAVILDTNQAGNNAVNIRSVAPGVGIVVSGESADVVTVGSQAPNQGGSLATIQGAVSVYDPYGASLVVDDSADMMGRNATLDPPPPNDPNNTATILTGLTPPGTSINWQLGNGSPVTILGGGGNSFVVHGALPNIVLTITGGAGNDLMIAGLTQVNFISSGGNDILIAGTTNYDFDPASISAIMTELAQANDQNFATIVNDLETGANGLPVLNASTVQSNGLANQLTGSANLDWFFASAADTVNNYIDGDVLTPIA
jgi:hypothetical protein